jgi:hypothetical protein
MLVPRDGRDRGLLRLKMGTVDRAPGDRIHLRVQMEVSNFHSWLRGSGAFSRVGVWIYAQTQQRIHRRVTRAFLRWLAMGVADASA